MSKEETSRQVLENEYLPVRAKILEIAASLDRIQRSEGDSADEPKWKQLGQAIVILLEEKEERAQRVQLLFSRPYDSQWRETFKMDR